MGSEPGNLEVGVLIAGDFTSCGRQSYQGACLRLTSPSRDQVWFPNAHPNFLRDDIVHKPAESMAVR